ncbi:LicD family protein [Catenovulum sediminis]|uniref:LicD family protein n=1 Tax=Catenovulum sediminis TaxID=1740262 RepID=A0ABV1RGZ2_9ALTE
MTIKTLLFGAGGGVSTYLENNQNRHYLGLLDNDENKIGTNIAGLEVFPLSILKVIEFDEIVLTTQWALDVKRQLIEQLYVPESKIVIPPKNNLKKAEPFFHQPTRDLALALIFEINSLAIDLKIPLVIDFGTLLGMVREQGVIKWDDDVDFSLPIGFENQMEQLLNRFVCTTSLCVNWVIEKSVDKQNKTLGFLLRFTSGNYDFVEFKTSFSFREIQGGNSVHLPSLGMWFAPKIYFNSFELLEVGRNKLQVPTAYEEYLSFLYGDWSKPKKDMRLSDYENINSVSFYDVKNAGLKVERL